MSVVALRSCSKLSTMRVTGCSASVWRSASGADVSGSRATPSWARSSAATACGVASKSSLRSVKTGRGVSSLPASSSAARRVLPTPPGPTMVTSRCLARSPATAARSRPRPTTGTAQAGRAMPPAGRALGISGRSSAAHSWWSRSGVLTPRSQYGPRSIRRSSTGADWRNSAAAAEEKRIWSDSAASATRCARWISKLE